MAKILLTGATGFVGSRLVSALLESEHEVRCALTRAVDHFKTEYVLVDSLEHHIDWTDALQGIDVIVHLAARVHVMKEKSESVEDEYDKINRLATENLARQAAELGVKRFIFLSSIKVHGESTDKGAPLTETSATRPLDYYGQSKLNAEKKLLSIGQQSGMQVVILRPPLIYGAGVKANFLNLLKWVEKKIPLPFGSVQNKRSFIYIDNLISAIMAVIDAPHAANQIYLVADDESLSLTDLLQAISSNMNIKVPLIPVPESLLAMTLRLLRRNSLRIRLLGSLEVNNTKIKTELGWNPPVSSREGLARTVRWYKNEYHV